MVSDSKHDYTFKKLTSSANQKQWTYYMAFVLEEAKLWDHVLGTAIPLAGTPILVVVGRWQFRLR